MTDATAELEEPKPKSIMLPLIVGVVGFLLLGGGAFYAVFSGMVLGPENTEEAALKEKVEPVADIAFVPMDPLLVSIIDTEPQRYLRFSAQLEVPKAYASDVSELMPRILDITNGYLRVLSLEDLQRPTSLLTVRAHILRRVELVVGNERVRDLLVTEFVIN